MEAAGRQPVKLAQEVIDELPPAAPGKRDTYRFKATKAATLTGLELRITDKGVKSFSYVARRPNGGNPLRVTLGKFPQDMRTAEAITRKWEKACEQVKRGENPAEEKRKARDELTVSEAFDAYRKKIKKKTAANDLNIFDNHIKGAIGARKLSSVTQDSLQDLHGAISEKESARKGRSSALKRTADQAATLLACVFELAGYKGDKNPARGIERNGDVKRKRYIQESEAPLFTEALNLLNSPDMRDLFLLCLYTGGRRGNVMGMKWRDLMGKMQWTIPASESKNGEAQSVMLAAEAVDIINARREAVDASGSIQTFVFPSTGKSGHVAEPKKAWAKVCDGMQIIEMLHALFPGDDGRGEREQWKANLQRNFPRTKKEILKIAAARGMDAEHFTGGVNLRVHDLRHTLGSWQAGQGVSLAIISKSLNHSSMKTTERYAHVARAPVQVAVANAVSAIAAAGNAPFKPRVVGLKLAPKA